MDLGRFEVPACAGPPYRTVRRIGMTLVAEPTVLERALALRSADGVRIVSRPLMKSHAAAGIGTVDGSWSILPEAPGVPMSLRITRKRIQSTRN